MSQSAEKPSILKRLLHRVFPVSPNFYALLNDQCDLAVEATGKLVEFMREGDPAVGAEIRRLEHEGDQLKARNLDALNRSFATAIDRDDIYRAIRSIDEVVNYAKSAVREMEALRVEPDPAMAEMAALLHEGTQALRRGYALLGSGAEAAEAEASAARKAERRTEKLYRHALSELFDDDRLAAVVNGADGNGTVAALHEVVQIFRRREVYRHLSNAADRLALAGDYLHDTVVKAI
jgi:uncharacterized protein Yka (UPF0111/DUF47 family)